MTPTPTPDHTAAPVEVFVTLGTDHHQFERLLGWVDRWQPPADVPVHVLVQHGSSPAPKHHDAQAFLTVDQLHRTVAAADVIVTQGGPGGIMDARQAGRIPIAVPRLVALDEVVDDHQVAFCRRLDGLGQIRCVEDEATLHAVLDASVRAPADVRCEPPPATVDEQTCAAFALAVETAVTDRRPGWRGRLPRRPRAA
jgi:UDP-N-acetylglucosamine transferase subunit ALG13